MMRVQMVLTLKLDILFLLECSESADPAYPNKKSLAYNILELVSGVRLALELARIWLCLALPRIRSLSAH